MPGDNRLPYWRLSGFYFFYFAALGAVLPFWSLYLQAEGFDATEIGELSAILVGSKIIAPYVWGWIADHYGHRMLIIRIASLLACVAYGGVFIDQGYWALALIMAVYGFFWNATLPQFEAATLNHIHDDTHLYTSIRVWGSIGFIVTVSLLGVFFAYTNISYLPAVIFLIMFLIFVASLVVHESDDVELPQSLHKMSFILKQPHVMALLAICFLMQMSHAPYYTFYSIYLEEHGYGRILIGNLWSLGVLAEVVVFMYMQRIVRQLGLRNVLIMSLFLASVRWVMIGFCVEYTALIVLGQLLHAASFGCFHAAAIQYIHQYFPGQLQGRGQALYSSISYGAGLALGSWLVGYSWVISGPEFSFTFAGLLAMLGVFIVQQYIKD